MSPEDLIRDLPIWPETPALEPVAGGYTNRNFRVTVKGEAYFARAGVDLPHHGISRASEALASKLAAGAGVAPEVVYAGGGILVTRAVPGETLKVGDPPGAATLAAAASLLARVHRIPAPAELGVADLAAVCRRYLESLEKETLGAQGRSRLEGILQRAPSLEAGTFVHGDAFPENFIHDRDRIWLVDWEYAGRGHPAADLAYLAVTLGIAADGLRALVEAHGGADVETVRDLLPLAAARDLLWCLAETQARGSTPALSLYTELSRKRLGL